MDHVTGDKAGHESAARQPVPKPLAPARPRSSDRPPWSLGVPLPRWRASPAPTEPAPCRWIAGWELQLRQQRDVNPMAFYVPASGSTAGDRAARSPFSLTPTGRALRLGDSGIQRHLVSPPTGDVVVPSETDYQDWLRGPAACRCSRTQRCLQGVRTCARAARGRREYALWFCAAADVNVPRLQHPFPTTVNRA